MARLLAANLALAEAHLPAMTGGNPCWRGIEKQREVRASVPFRTELKVGPPCLLQDVRPTERAVANRSGLRQGLQDGLGLRANGPARSAAGWPPGSPEGPTRSEPPSETRRYPPCGQPPSLPCTSGQRCPGHPGQAGDEVPVLVVERHRDGERKLIDDGFQLLVGLRVIGDHPLAQGPHAVGPPFGHRHPAEGDLEAPLCRVGGKGLIHGTDRLCRRLGQDHGCRAHQHADGHGARHADRQVFVSSPLPFHRPGRPPAHHAAVTGGGQPLSRATTRNGAATSPCPYRRRACLCRQVGRWCQAGRCLCASCPADFLIRFLLVHGSRVLARGWAVAVAAIAIGPDGVVAVIAKTEPKVTAPITAEIARKRMFSSSAPAPSRDGNTLGPNASTPMVPMAKRCAPGLPNLPARTPGEGSANGLRGACRSPPRLPGDVGSSRARSGTVTPLITGGGTTV